MNNINIKRILVLDDNDGLLEMMKFILTDCGYDTMTLSRGNNIHHHINQYVPHLILMDVMLAGMDGREICKGLKIDLQCKIPIMLISGTHNIKQVMLQAGAPDDFLAKPFDLDELLTKVAKQIEKPSIAITI